MNKELQTNCPTNKLHLLNILKTCLSHSTFLCKIAILFCFVARMFHMGKYKQYLGVKLPSFLFCRIKQFPLHANPVQLLMTTENKMCPGAKDTDHCKHQREIDSK